MADESIDSQLRDMAQHRGLKLVKSRRRKPGTGDFGRYGLTDDKGKPLLGVGEDGLTASADDIESYLRAGTASSWKQSAKSQPDSPRIRNVKDSGDGTKEQPPVSRRVRRTPPARAATARAPGSPPRRKAHDVPADVPAKVKLQRARAAQEPPEQPRLVVRAAKPGDANSLARLLGQLNGVKTTARAVAENLAASRKAGGGAVVAELGEPVGCCCWVVVSSLHRGPVGRITSLIVVDAYRRQGIGSRLLGAAEEALAGKGCPMVEVMSDIEIKNSHNFFRTLKFEQASYRFTRKLGARRSR